MFTNILAGILLRKSFLHEIARELLDSLFRRWWNAYFQRSLVQFLRAFGGRPLVDPVNYRFAWCLWKELHFLLQMFTNILGGILLRKLFLYEIARELLNGLLRPWWNAYFRRSLV